MLAPLAVNVAELPAQMTEGDADALTATAPLTDTVTEAVDEHELVVPVAEYVVVADGLTVILAVVAPLLHK